MPTETARRPRLSERIRLIRILRTHGLRAVERLRADELRLALDKLGLTLNLDEERPGPVAPPSASSSELAQRGEEPPPTQEEPTEEVVVDTLDPRFREPDVFLPAGERTFVRLIAVDSNHLYATWDLDGGARARLGGDEARLLVRVADTASGEPGDVLFSETIRVSAGGWYLRAPEPRLRVVAALATPSGEVLVSSNPCVVPPSHPAPPGPLRFATVPVSVDRRRLRGGLLLRALIDEETDLPESVVVEESGRVVRARLEEQEESAPSSGEKRRLLSQGGPTLPSVQSAPSSWRSASSSSGGKR